MEAQAAGLPIIHNGYAGMERYNDIGIRIAKEVGRLGFDNNIDKTQFEPWIYCITALLSDPQLWEKLSKKSLESAKTYSWDEVVKQYWRPLIEEMVK
jgi:glycosyltransferase involved in cell wall biosynthesis